MVVQKLKFASVQLYNDPSMGLCQANDICRRERERRYMIHQLAVPSSSLQCLQLYSEKTLRNHFGRCSLTSPSQAQIR